MLDKIGLNFDIEEIKRYFKNIINDKKKREYAILVIIFLFIAILVVKDFFEPSAVTTKENFLDDNINQEQVAVVSDIYVDISGAVNKPGVYKVTSQTRLFEVINMAEGLTADADIDSINQAELVFDGQKIIVKCIGSDLGINTSSTNTTQNGKVSINNADLEQLKTLPGIGTTKAQRIIDYRNTNGKFKTIEDIRNVTGIGDATYQSIKDLICI